MSDSHFSRLEWIKSDFAPIKAGGLESVEMAEEGSGATTWMTPAEQALCGAGFPVAPPGDDRATPLAEAKHLLRAASEIEHGLLVQYLYAGYSCAQLLIARKVVQIAKEEMGHLISVQNLLLAVCGHPYFGRDNFPTSPMPGGPFPFALTFEPLSADSLAKYVVAESPPLENITDPALAARVAPIIATGKLAAHQAINHVGALYVALYWLFKKDDTPPDTWPDYPTSMVQGLHQQLGRTNWHVPDEAFAPQADLDDLQADNAKENWNKGNGAIIVNNVPSDAGGKADRAAMLATLFEIAEQGEGWVLPPDSKKSHFLRFLETFEALKAIVGTPPILPLPINPTTIGPPAPELPPANFIANPEANLWARIFNVRYRIALLKLALVMATIRTEGEGTAAGRAKLIEGAIAGEMVSNLKTLAQELVKMRRKGLKKDGPEPSRAAPTFELPGGSLPNLVGLDTDPKIAEKKAVISLKKALKDALNETAALVAQIVTLPPEPLDQPSEREFLTDVLVPGDQALLAALG